jgi:DNA repair exonuclease SbcCD nuclease subunit
MIKILHSADWHLDAPLLGKEELKKALASVPVKLANLCKEENCDLVLLSGDLFDGAPSADSVAALKKALAQMEVPVFITPGNHDFVTPGSIWLTEVWPENVTVFTENQVKSQVLDGLDCTIYGAAFTSMDCPALLEGFRASHTTRYGIGIFHGDPTMVSSAYNPITQTQIRQSGLDYLALGHIHKAGSLLCGDTLCLWPGCPMGKDYGEPGEKGAYIITLDHSVSSKFVPLDTPRFYDLTLAVNGSAQEVLEKILPPAGSMDYYRITLTGESEKLDIPLLLGAFSHIPHLELLDSTVAPVDVWKALGTDTLEGQFFGMLKEAMDATPDEKEVLLLAAELSRRILDGQEVVLP